MFIPFLYYNLTIIEFIGFRYFALRMLIKPVV